MAVKKQTSLADALADIARAAPSLRAAGVLHISVGDVSANLAPGADERPERPNSPPSPVEEVDLGDLNAAFGEERKRRAGVLS